MKTFTKKLILYISILTVTLGSHNQLASASTTSAGGHDGAMYILGASVLTSATAYLLRNHLLEKAASSKLLNIDPWQNIDKADLTKQKLTSISQSFLWGASTAAYQIEGGITNSWTYYPDPNGTKHDAGRCCNSWNMLEEDIECLQKIGAKSYRFSIEWARLQQHNENEWDEAALEKYVDFCRKLQAANIEPVITLHHYSDPIWFMQKGGFTKSENISYFIAYVEKVYTALASLNIKYFVTFNQPAGYAYKSYCGKMAPPYGEGSPYSPVKQTTFNIVLNNLFTAHVQSYKAIDRIAQTQHVIKPLISISHQYTQMKVSTQMKVAMDALNYLGSQVVSHIADQYIYNGPFEKFFLTGEGKKYMDFIALSYYCPQRFHGKQNDAYTPEELKYKADKDGRIIDGDGFYDALVWAQKFKKPILVVENGIETDDHAKRILFLNRYLSKMNDAMRDGINVIGYCYWSLIDNFEWTKGFDYHFGLFSVNRADGSFKRTLKLSGEYYKDIIALNS